MEQRLDTGLSCKQVSNGPRGLTIREAFFFMVLLDSLPAADRSKNIVRAEETVRKFILVLNFRLSHPAPEGHGVHLCKIQAAAAILHNGAPRLGNRGTLLNPSSKEN